MRRQRRGTYLPESNPYPPFFAAICAHIVVAALIVILPSIAIQRPPEEVITVNLADMPAPDVSGAKGGPPPKAESKPQVKPAPPVQPPVEPPPEPVKIEATAVKKKPEPQVTPPPPPPPPKVVSLKPSQVKKVPPEPPPKEPVKKKDDQAVKREMDKIREQLTKEKQRQEVNRLRQQLAQEDKLRDQRKRDQAAAESRAAQADADRLRSQLEGLQAQSRLMEAREQGLLGSSSTRNSQNDNARSAASSGVDSTLMQQYLARLKGQLQSYWKLPDYKDWPANLLAKVVVTIDKNGKILDVQLEKRSGDDAFDRLVRKTLDDADPLPPIPPALKKERLEIGFNFTPGSITGR